MPVVLVRCVTAITLVWDETAFSIAPNNSSELCEVSASLRKAPRFLAEIGQPRIRRTEVRPMFSRRAISALLTPARYSFRTIPA